MKKKLFACNGTNDRIIDVTIVQQIDVDAPKATVLGQNVA